MMWLELIPNFAQRLTLTGLPEESTIGIRQAARTRYGHLIEAARVFLKTLPSSERPLWMQMVKMMKFARRAEKAPFKRVSLQQALSEMALGGT